MIAKQQGVDDSLTDAFLEQYRLKEKTPSAQLDQAGLPSATYTPRPQRTDAIWQIVTGAINEPYKRSKKAYEQAQAIFKNRSQPKPLTEKQKHIATSDIRERMRRIALEGGQY